MRLISWNLNARRRDATAQVDALLARAPDVIALQEVTRSSLPTLRSELERSGFAGIADSLTLAPPDFQPRGPRRYGQLTASRYPLIAEVPGRLPIPWPERVLTVQLDLRARRIMLYNVHVPPGSSNGWIKIETLNGIHQALAVHTGTPRILCGDSNTPQFESATGEVVTWAQRPGASEEWRTLRTLRGRSGSEWDAGERRVLTGLTEYDLADVYRHLHGYAATDSSWILRRGGREIGRRFDHVFASRSLVPRSCEYLHHLRAAGLSDHAPIEVTFAPEGVAAAVTR
jgi:exonuclease III